MKIPKDFLSPKTPKDFRYSYFQSRKHYSFKTFILISSTRLSLSKAFLSRKFQLINLEFILNHISNFFSKADSVCPMPFSLAANQGITICFLLLLVLRCFNSQRVSSSQIKTFLHSEISGSNLACKSPELIAACHVLHHSLNQAIRLTVL